MVDRICKLPKSHSFFLFGARGTGKTTLLNEHFSLIPSPPEDTLVIDLLDPDQDDLYSRNPNLLKEQLNASPKRYRRVIVDEVQKVPQLLDVVHFCIERHKAIQFILTGSSARKLKHGGANLLGGRAFSVYLHPFTSVELPDVPLKELLAWGGLPMIFQFHEVQDKLRFLKSYVQTYLKQEVQLEQLVRNIVSFRDFLDVASQCNGEIINYTNIAAQTNVDEKTVARYFEILIDTHLGLLLEPFDESVRVRQSQKPRFYLFDTGITRQLNQTAELPLQEGSSEYGRLFEQFILCEISRLNDYYERNFKLFFLNTKDGAEIDLILRKPGKKTILIEIKSSTQIQERHLSHLTSLGADIKHEERWVICDEPLPRRTDNGILILPWRQALARLFDLTA